MKKIRVGVIRGGRSGEHEVSLRSAESILKAIDRNKYDVVPITITHEGRWEPFTISPDPSGERPVDVVFPIVHGTYGEDGTIQGLFELANVPYVGAGVLGSAVGMDKDVMKRLFRDARLPVVKWVLLLRKEWQQDPRQAQGAIEQKIGYPLFVKPANLGSSVGISKVRNAKELPRAIDLAAEYDRKIL